MPKYLVQLTQEGGPEGTKVIDADQVTFAQSGAVIFQDLDDNLIIAFPTFEAIVQTDFIPYIEADTAAFNAATA